MSAVNKPRLWGHNMKWLGGGGVIAFVVAACFSVHAGANGLASDFFFGAMWFGFVFVFGEVARVRLDDDIEKGE